MTRRLLISYLTVTIVVLALLEIPLAVFFSQREYNRLVADAERDATVLASYYEDALEDESAPVPAEAIQYTTTTGARVVVVDDAGISIVDTGAPVPRDFSTRPEVAEALAGRRAAGERFSSTLDQDLLYVSVPVASGGTVHGALRLTFDPHEVTERVQRFWIALAAIAVVALAVVATVGSIIARSVTKPLRHLQTAATRFAKGDLTNLEPQPGAPREITELESSMNLMAARLDRMISQQREFIGDASHQLRTPLTALRLRLENLTHTVDGSTEAELDAAIAETDRLATLVADLLSLARTEEAAALIPVDLVAAATERHEIWGAVADEHDVNLTVSLGGPAQRGPVWVGAAPSAIDQILDNLIDNAIGVSAAGAEVQVRVTASNDRATLQVVDRGPGLDRAAKSRATERFWRGDQSRPGTGLGLAIVARLAELCQADFSLEDNRPTGLAAQVTFDQIGTPDPGQINGSASALALQKRGSTAASRG